MNYTLSYIITTRNKLQLLKSILADLLLHKTDDEEIVIVDANSTDGTKEYLTELLNTKKINQFISESDKGEAHGWNKAILMAKGDLVKFITDDDLYYYPAIKKCKKFMLDNKQVEVMAFEGFYTDMNLEKANIRPIFFTKNYINWINTKQAFLFCGISLLIRKTAFAHLGLFSNLYKAVDYEYALRITSMPISFAWYTGFAYVNIKNAQSNSTLFDKIILDERKKLLDFYSPGFEKITISKKIKSKLKHVIKPNGVNKEFIIYWQNKNIDSQKGKKFEDSYYDFSHDYLHEFNKLNKGEIIFGKAPQKFLGENFNLKLPQM